MFSLKDLAPLSDTVGIRGNELTVYPLQLADIGALVAKFKGLRAIFSEDADMVDVIMNEGREAIDAAIAAAVRQPVADVANFTASEQVSILIASIEMTLPDDEAEFESFMGRLAVMFRRVPAAQMTAGQ